MGSPANAPFGATLTAEFHINTNDAGDPYANDPDNNVRVTLTVSNGVFVSIPPVCKTTGVTPLSAISANGTQLLCNVGTITEGTATVIQAPVKATGAVGSALSVSGTVTSDSAVAPTSPAAPSGLSIVGSHGMDLVLSAPNQNYQQTTVPSRSGGNRPSVVVDYGVAMTAGSIPGPSTYTFTVDIAVSVPGQLPGLQWEGCAPVDNSAQATGIPYSASSFVNRTNAPTCSISGSGTHYTVTLSGLDYSLQHVPTVDSLGNAISSATNFIAAGQLTFSYTTPITTSTGVTFGATPSQFTFVDGVTQPETNTSNDASGTSLVLPGVFSMIWMGSPTAGRSPWDANLWAAPGAAQNQTFPWPAAGSSTSPGPYFLRDEPLGGQADSVTWSTYSGVGGTDMAGSCVMVQNPAAFSPRWADFLAADGASYSNITTAHLWYRTDVLNTKTETCGEPVGVAGSPWTSAPLPAGCATQTASISPAYSDDQCIVSLPAGVTAVKMTWNPAVDKQFHHFLRVWGYVPLTAPIGAESWVVGAFNAPYNTATVFPGYPTLNNYINISTSPSVIAVIPGSTYGPNTNGIRDAMRIQGPSGVITKSTLSTTAQPGVPVTYNLTAESDLSGSNPPNQTFTVTDTLPTGMSYVAGSGTPTPSLSVNGSGQQVLTYAFTNVPANTAQPITYQAQIPANGSVAPGTVLTNTAQVDVPGDNRPAAARQATASVTVPNSGATTLGKSVESNVLSFYGDSSAWDLTINSQDPVSNPYTDTIDILPYVGDGRGTNNTGTYTIGTVTAAGATVYYTTANPSTLSSDPRNASNGSTPGSIAGNAVGWTTVKPATPTAIRVIGPALAPGASQTIRIAFTTLAGTSCTGPAPTDNLPGQLLVNSANAIAGHTALPMLSSATTMIGNCYALSIVKYVLVKGGNPANQADYHDANTVADYQQYAVGDTLNWKVVVANKGTGTLTNISVTDPLVPGCAFTVASLAAAASQTQTCTSTAATGTTINTAQASVTPPTGPQLTPSDPAGVVVPDPYHVAKTSNPASGSNAAAGSIVTYTVTVSEPAASAAPSLNPSFTDDLSAVLDDAAYNNDVTAGAGTVSVSGNNLSWSSALLAPGQSVTITYSVTVRNPDNGDRVLKNTVVTPAGSNCAPPSTDPACSTMLVVPPVPQVSVSKSTSATTLVPGGTIVYVVTVSNTGAVPANGTTVTDPLPTGLASATWTCAGSGGTTCAAAGTGAVNDTLAAFPVGGAATYTVTAIVSATPPAQVINTATATPPGNGLCTPGNTASPCTATVTVPPVPQVGITKTANTTTLTPAGTIIYTVTVSNTGSIPANGTTVSDPLPTGLVSATWTCTGSGGATCAVSGSGAISDTLAALPVGGVATYTVTATASANPPAAVTNTVSATPPSGGVCTPGGTSPPCTAKVAVTPVPQVGITKTANTTSLTPSGTIVYTVTVSNNGSVPANNTAVSDPLPPGLASATWTCAGSGGTTCAASGTGAISDTLAAFPVGGVATYTITATVSGAPPATVTNTASATPPGGGVCAPGNTAAPCNSTVTVAPVPQVSITKSTSATTLTPGGTIVYTIVASNTGAVDATGTQVSDPTPTGVASQNWTCSASGGAACPNLSGSGNVNETLATFPAGSSVTYTVTATASASPPASVTNTASVNPPPGGVCTPGNTAPPCNSTVTVPSVPQVNIQKSTPATTLTPGGTIVYTIVASNTGTVSAAGTVVADPVPTGIASQTWTCSGTGGAVCPNASGAGNLNETLATFPASSSVTYTVTATVGASPPAHVINTATATPPSGGVCTPNNTPSPCPSTVTVPQVPQVSIQKSTPATTLTPGGSIVYTIVASNTGAASAAGTIVADPIPTGITTQSWSCVASGGAACPNPSGTGALNEMLATFPAGSTVTYTVTAIVSASPPAHVTNTASANPPPGGICTPGNTAPPCTSTVTVPAVAQVSVAKTANTTTLTPGGTIIYTVIATNGGSIAAPNTVVADPIPTGIATMSWTCAASGGAVCSNASGSGALNETLATFPAGGVVTYTLTATVSAPASLAVTNTASVTPPPGGVCLPGNTQPPCNSGVTILPPNVIDPPFITKSVTAVDAQTLSWTIVVDNNMNAVAQNTEIRDPMPANVTYVAGMLTCQSFGGSTISQCVFDTANNRIVVDAVLQSDLGVANAATAPDRIVVTFQTRYIGNPVAVTNIASACWDANNSSTNINACVQNVQGAASYTPPQTPQEVPIDAWWVLLLLGLIFATSALFNASLKQATTRPS